MKRHDRHFNMGKRAATAVALALMILGGFHSAEAQILILNEDEYLRSDRTPADADWVAPILTQGTEIDQYMPLGEGWLLLIGLGGGYFLSKKRKQEGE
jgi:hypothetical protein